jgi:uncharacterized linocin/CFP29 family protein
MEPNLDVIMHNGQGVGTVAQKLLTNGNSMLDRPFYDDDGVPCIQVYHGGDRTKIENYSVKPLNTNATLRRDEWKALDEVLLEVNRYRLGGIEDLKSNGLVYNLGNPMGTTMLEWHTMGDAMEAVLTMDAITRGKNDRPTFNYHYLPIPILHVDYEINARELSASRSLGNPLDTTSAALAARKVAEKLEDLLFTNTSYAWGEKGSDGMNTIYSYINYPHRNQVTISGHWDDSGVTAADVLEDVQNMKKAAVAKHFYGPYMLYIPTNYEGIMDNDYNSTAQTTIRERIMKLGGIKGIKVVDALPSDNVLLVQMTPDVVRLINGMGLTNIEWSVEGKMLTKYKVMCIQVPQIRSDDKHQCGVTHGASA